LADFLPAASKAVRLEDRTALRPHPGKSRQNPGKSRSGDSRRRTSVLLPYEIPAAPYEIRIGINT
jgi:hypothetical protein